MRLDQAKALVIGQTLYHVTNRNADGTPQRWRVNGTIKTWKRDPSRVKVPIKYGMYGYDYLTEDTLGYLMLSEEEAYAVAGRIK